MKKYFIIFLISMGISYANSNIANTNYALSMLPSQYNFLKNVTSAQKAQKPVYTILYLYSNSVPTVDFANMLYGVYFYNKTHQYKLQTIQTSIGINNNQYKYLTNLKTLIYRSQNAEVRNSLMGMIDITISPEVFERLSVKKAPVLALARCMPKAHPSKCQILYIAHGSIGVVMFMNKLKEKKLLPKDLK